MNLGYRVKKAVVIGCCTAISIGMLVSCNSGVTTLPSFVPQTGTTPVTSTAPSVTDTVLPGTGSITDVIIDPSVIPTPTPVLPTDTSIGKDEVENTLKTAINDKNVNVIYECCQHYPELMTQYKSEIESAVLVKTDEYVAVCSSSDYNADKLKEFKQLGFFKDIISSKLSDSVTDLTVQYVNDKLSSDSFTAVLKRIYSFNEFASELAAANAAFDVVKNDKIAYNSAVEELNKGNTDKAFQLFSNIGKGYFYAKAQEKIAFIKADSEKIEMLNRAIARYKLLDYEGAIANLEKFLKKYPDDVQATDLLGKYKSELEEFKKETELYSVRNIRNVFTHSLIAFPEIELNNKANAHGDLDCLTPNEFRALLEAFYRSGYVLIDYRLMYEIVVDDEGNETLEMRSKIRVPKGKKPMVLSIDAVFNTANEGRGLTDKVILHQGKIASYTKLKNGEEVISYDNEVFGILESFIESHPDFSFNGAKCVVAPTGYYGFLGHQVQKYSDFYKKTENPADVREKAIEEAKELIEYMLNNGYTFGSHTYSHPHMKNQSEAELKAELEAWQNEIGYLLGDIDYYIYPFGDYGKETGNQGLNDVIHDFGFYIFNGCGAACYNINGFPWDRSEDVIFIDRFTLAGQTLRYYGEGKTGWIKEWDLLLTDGTTPKDIYDHENRYIKYGS